MRGPASLVEETSLALAGFRAIAGLDEAGRGSWAGPLVAAAVVLPEASSDLDALADLRDSKQLTAKQREAFAATIEKVARAVGVCVVPAEQVDRLGLARAGRIALTDAARSLPLTPDFALVDAFLLPELRCLQRGIIFGDSRCLSIAAASVIAKVMRDRLLCDIDTRYPGYGFGSHKGYGTKDHQEALARLGPCPEHRRSYAPLRLRFASA